MTKKACVIGYQIAHSKSPHIHNHWLDQYNIDGSYEIVDINPEDFEEKVTCLKENFVGWNITSPYKVKMMKHVDLLTSNAGKARAINTVYKDSDDKWVGANTDIIGIEKTLIHSKASYINKQALILGAGGAAQAAIIALENSGVKSVFMSNRTVEKIEELKTLFPKIEVLPWDQVDEKLDMFDLIINATSCGLYDQNLLPFTFEKLHKEQTVLDMVYTPLKTKLLKQAKEKGCITLDGLWMLLHQATRGFENWFNQKPIVDNSLRDKIKGII